VGCGRGESSEEESTRCYCLAGSAHAGEYSTRWLCACAPPPAQPQELTVKVQDEDVRHGRHGDSWTEGVPLLLGRSLQAPPGGGGSSGARNGDPLRSNGDFACTSCPRCKQHHSLDTIALNGATLEPEALGGTT
jgi:hypothetical protein